MAWRWLQRLSWPRLLTWARRHRTWLAGIGTVAAVTALVYSAWQGGGDWPTLVVAMAAVLVAWQFGRAQRDLGDVMRYLTLAPVLSAWFPPEYPGSVIEVENAGNGPAMDLRATLLAKSSADPQSRGVTSVPVRCERAYLGRGKFTRVRLIGDRLEQPSDVMRKTDVWILHCGDLNGIHWHAVSNFTHEKEGNAANETFLFWRLDQSPQWIRQNCERCKELGFR